MGAAKYPASKCLSIYNRLAGTSWVLKSQEGKDVVREVRLVLGAPSDKDAAKLMREGVEAFRISEIWRGDWKRQYPIIKMARLVRAAWAEEAS